jgi:hypothetical protein
MPRGTRIGTVFLAVTVLLAGSFEAARASGPGQRFLSGVARDTAGNALQDVEILILADAVMGGSEPVAVARTATNGRYLIPNLAPGLYRVAAIKEGYLAFVGRVNTLVRNSLDLVLRPVTIEDGYGLGVDEAAWALRLPARSLLRETDASELLRGDATGGATVVRIRQADLIQGQLDHLFAFAGMLPGRAGEAAEGHGAETHVHLRGGLGARGSLNLQARRESLDDVALDTTEPAQASRGSATVVLDLAYDTSRDSSLAVRAFYAHRDLRLEPGHGSAFLPERQEQRTLGYEAAWSRQLDGDSRLEVRMDLVDSTLALSEAFSAEFSAYPGGIEPSVSNRAVGAGGLYETLLAGGHRLTVGFRAQLQDLPLPAVRAHGEGLFSARPWSTGWSVRASAEDQWAVSGPLTLLYGIGLAGSLEQGGTTLLVPRAGAIWTTDGVSVRMLLAWHEHSGGDEELAFDAVRAPYRPRQPLGYEAGFEAPLPLGLRLSGEVSYHPVLYDVFEIGNDPSAVLDPGPFLTDGNASRQRSVLTLERPSGVAHAYIQYATGSADGTLAALAPFDLPLQVLSHRQVNYQSGVVGVRLPSTGTDVVAEYRRVEEMEAAELDGRVGQAQEYVEVRITQDLIRLRSRGAAWRLLVAARAASSSNAEDLNRPASFNPATLAALANRVSAGVSVAF